MITITERAANELQGLLDTQGAQPGQGVKLVPDQASGIGMTIAAPTEGDVVVPRGEDPLLIVDPRITPLIEGAVLDVEAAADADGKGPRFKLRRPEPEG